MITILLELAAKYVWPALVIVLLLVIVGQRFVIKHKDTVIVEQSLALNQANALYKEEVRINEVNQKAADKKHIIGMKQEEELKRAYVPENCEEAMEWMIKVGPLLK